MSGVERLDIDQAFERLLQLIPKAGGPATDTWDLIEGITDDGRPRTPWVIVNGDHRPVITLGYNRRAALYSLNAMNSICAVILGA